MHENQTKSFFALKAERHWGNPRNQLFLCRKLGKSKETWKPEQIRFVGFEPRQKHGKIKEVRFLGVETQEKPKKTYEVSLKSGFRVLKPRENLKKHDFTTIPYVF